MRLDVPRLDKGNTFINDTHTPPLMTRAKPIGPVVHELKALLLKSDTHTLKDYEVMDALGFSVQSWKIWRPTLREICADMSFTDSEHKDGWDYQAENYKISYDKKIWKIIQQPLMKKKNGEKQSIPMTEQDHEKLIPRDSPINY